MAGNETCFNVNVGLNTVHKQYTSNAANCVFSITRSLAANDQIYWEICPPGEGGANATIYGEGVGTSAQYSYFTIKRIA